MMGTEPTLAHAQNSIQILRTAQTHPWICQLTEKRKAKLYTHMFQKSLLKSKSPVFFILPTTDILICKETFILPEIKPTSG